MVIKTLLFIALINIFFIQLATAGVGTYDGTEDGFWDDHSVIVARVVGVHKGGVQGLGFSHLLTIQTLLTIAGHFDPAEQDQLDASLSVGPFNATVAEAPEKGSLIMVVLVSDGPPGKRVWFVEPNICKFVPGDAGMGLTMLSGLDDKNVAETRDRIRKARAAAIAARNSLPPPADGRKSGDALPAADLGNGVKLDLVYIAPGEFDMGSPESEATAADQEDELLHHVKLTHAFGIGKFPVTQAQWKALMENNPSTTDASGGRLPVETVSWLDANLFCCKLKEQTGKRFRLPTEAEWEYACRAGTKTQYNTGDGEKALGEAAWYVANSSGTIHHVGQKKPNAWNLYDMHGNVLQWCADVYESNYYKADAASLDPRGPFGDAYSEHVLRGGSYGQGAFGCRSACRYKDTPDDTKSDFGLRVCLEME